MAIKLNDKIMALCDSEKTYLQHMTEYLKEKSILPFAIHAFTNLEQYKQFSKANRVELLLIAEHLYEKETDTYYAEGIIILNESGETDDPSIKNINKYQSSDCIFREIIGYYAGEANGQSRRAASKSAMKIIGNYSPVRRCLQTTFTLCMGQFLAKKHKTLYLNFESFSGLGYLMNRDFAADLTDILYYFDCEREKLAFRLEEITQTMNGLNFIPPVASYEDLNEITGKQWMSFIKEIEAVTEYEYLILDLSEQMQGLFDILRECFKVFTVTREDGFAAAKIRNYEEILSRMKYEDIAAKTRKWDFPQFYKLPADLGQLTHGEMAVFVKKMIEEEIYGSSERVETAAKGTDFTKN